MSRTVLAVVLLSHLASQLAAQDVADGPAWKPEGWGEVVDPDGDCTVRFGDEKMVIQVPGSPHDLSAELGIINAPRVLREVEGDFIAQVKVVGIVKPGGGSKIPGRTPYNGAGLLLWLDGENYVRLERAGLTRPDTGKFQPYANFELRQKDERGLSSAGRIADEPVHLRLERRGDRVIGSVSRDGLTWGALEPMATKLPGKVRVGVAAINSASEPFKAEFEEFAIFRREALAK